MADKDIVNEWLGSAARRIRLNERAESVSRMCASLLLLALAWYATGAVIRTPQVISAIFPLFVVAAAAVLAYFAWRILRGPNRALAAVVVDARAGLNNEVASALWFTSGAVSDVFVRAHLARAAHTLSQLNPAHMVPFARPRSLPLVAGLLLATAVAAWFSVPYDGREAPDIADTSSSPLSDRVTLVSEYGEDVGNTEQFVDERAAGAWLRVEQLARELRAGPDTERIAEAIAVRDAKSAARLLAGIRREQATQAASGSIGNINGVLKVSPVRFQANNASVHAATAGCAAQIWAISRVSARTDGFFSTAGAPRSAFCPTHPLPGHHAHGIRGKCA